MSAEFAVLEAAPDAMLVVDRAGTVVFANRLANAMFGYDELAGESIDALVPASTRNAHAAKRAEYAAAPRPRPMGFGELAARRRDGVEFPAEISLAPLQRAADVLTIVAVRDVTQRKVVELQLQTARRMEAIGRLAGGVAHDFNNLLTVILSYASLALDGLKRIDPVREDVEEIRRAAERASDLVKQLLAFGRKQVLQPRPTDLRDLIGRMEKLVRRLMGDHVVVTFLEPGAIGTVSIDPVQIEQVVMNLAVNARDAMPTGGRLTIETANVELDASYAAAHAGVRPGSYVMLAVTDTGIGMDEAIRAHLFEPFFTTKEQGRGTGLGLATVFGIVQQSGGHIWVYSEPNRGTTFKLYFPRVEAPAEAPASPQALGARGGTETVLLVEDDEAVRKLMTTVLRRAGYNVLETQNGGEALVVSERYEATIHLLLTDVVMPHMSGRELAQRIASARPTMKVLFMSGYTQNTIVHHGVLDAGVAFLPKPTTPAALLAKVRAALD